MLTSKTIRSQEDLIIFTLECNLATVSNMAMKKSRQKSEYDRQISIAQTSIDFIKGTDINVTVDSRAYKVLSTPSQSVKEWAAQYEEK